MAFYLRYSMKFGLMIYRCCILDIFCVEFLLLLILNVVLQTMLCTCNKTSNANIRKVGRKPICAKSQTMANKQTMKGESGLVSQNYYFERCCISNIPIAYSHLFIALVFEQLIRTDYTMSSIFHNVVRKRKYLSCTKIYISKEE